MNPREEVRQVCLDGLKTGARSRGVDVIGIGDASVKAALLPGSLFASQITLDPWDGDQGPHAGPTERKGPTQLQRISFLANFGVNKAYSERDRLRNGEDNSGDGSGADD